MERKEKKEGNTSYDPQYDPRLLDKLLRDYEMAVKTPPYKLEYEFPSLKKDIRRIRKKAEKMFDKEYPNATELCKLYVLGDPAKKPIEEAYKTAIRKNIRAMSDDATRGKKVRIGAKKGGDFLKEESKRRCNLFQKEADRIKKEKPEAKKIEIARWIHKKLSKIKDLPFDIPSVSTIRQRIK